MKAETPGRQAGGRQNELRDRETDRQTNGQRAGKRTSRRTGRNDRLTDRQDVRQATPSSAHPVLSCPVSASEANELSWR